jgi:hypothetical protein
LTEKKQAFEWIPKMKAAIQALKEALCSALILASPQPRERFLIDTDASKVGNGVLTQVQDGQERVITYYSNRLNKAERNYCVT